MTKPIILYSDNEALCSEFIVRGYEVKKIASGRITPVVQYGKMRMIGLEDIRRYFSLS